MEEMKMKMTEVEVLKFKNLVLQRQLLEKDNYRINIEESSLVNEISKRLGINNPKECIFDIDNGIITQKPETK